ncbi:hypothetical protein M514_09107 [Trichuris suis]|uniref:Uncharacterized protein n=1 Tax=Trichuris suis TaxID=68888 RepID=A0A085N5K0_9BILA|nr:hypothetical protein M513_09107 [Trichuris suis]KFD64746.1 hypothetical protein M514_09107 [Trichuris suis]
MIYEVVKPSVAASMDSADPTTIHTLSVGVTLLDWFKWSTNQRSMLTFTAVLCVACSHATRSISQNCAAKSKEQKKKLRYYVFAQRRLDESAIVENYGLSDCNDQSGAGIHRRRTKSPRWNRRIWTTWFGTTRGRLSIRQWDTPNSQLDRLHSIG